MSKIIKTPSISPIMGRIDTLVNELCLDGVEMVRLGEIASLLRGKVISKSYVRDNEGEYPVYSSQTANDGEFGRINTYMFDGDYLTWTTDGIYAGTIFRRRGKFSITNICGLIDITTDKISIDFLYYWLSITTTKYVNRAIDNPKLMSNVVELIEVPLPPLSIQQKIVSVLDSFTTLIDKMKQEVEKRKKQMEYYREKLLTFEDGECEWKPIKKIFETRNGYTPSTNNNEFWINGTLPWFKMEDIREKGRILSDSAHHITPQAIKGKGLFKSNSIILATSATIGEHALVTVEHLSNQRFTNFYPKQDYKSLLDMRFVYYYFYLIDEWCKEHTIQGSFAGVNMTELYNYLFPIPSLSKQSEIVSTLDKFESYITKLEKMIVLRQKQYEYYREKLLTFR